MQDRRRLNRWKVNRSCEVRLGETKEFTSCTLRDISLKGMQLALKMKLPKDTFLKLSLFCHEKYTLDIEVWVAWQHSVMDGYCYGFYFSRIADSEKEKIFKFVRECYPRLMAQCWWGGSTEEKGGKEMEDHRIFDRVLVNLPMRYIDPRSGVEGQAQMQDISAKGIGLVTQTGLSRKTSLEMWIDVPDKGEPLYTRGEVVWSQMVAPQKFRTGVILEKADLMGLSRVLRVTE